jgi:hypothetical protein
MESRPYGGSRTNFVQIVCGWCGYEAWFPAKNGGWAMRIFRAHGWKVGSKDAQHRCPKCFGRAIAGGRRSPDNPVIPKELGTALKTAMKETHVRDALLGTSSLNTMPEALPPPGLELSDKAKAMLREKPAKDPLYVADLIVPATAEEPPAPVPEPASGYLKPVRGQQSVPGRTVWPHRPNAASSGVRQTRSVDGLGFFTVPAPGGWTWKKAPDVTPEEKAAWLESRHYGPRPSQRADGSKPDMGATITAQVPRPDGTISIVTVPLRDAVNITEEEPPMTTVTPIRKDVMPTQAAPTPTVDAPRSPTRDERALIHDALTTGYDSVDQRYLKDGSDKALAAKLDVPRAWVTDIRVAFFGDYDRNAESEKQKLKLDDAITLAKAATTRLLEMAGEAETLEQRLVAARKLLED